MVFDFGYHRCLRPQFITRVIYFNTYLLSQLLQPYKSIKLKKRANVVPCQ